MDQSDDYSQTQIPSVFVEPVQASERRPGGIGRAHLVVVSLILFGALVATAAGLQMVRNGEQAEWTRIRQKLEAERVSAIERAGRLDITNTRLAADLEQANARIEKYGAVEYQLNLIREKTQQIEDLRKAKPSYPHNLQMNVGTIPEWSAPGAKLLKEFVAKLDAERARLIAFREPKPATGPATPQITPAAGPTAREPN